MQWAGNTDTPLSLSPMQTLKKVLTLNNKRVICYRCNSNKISLHSRYNTKAHGYRNRFRCTECNYDFILRDKTYGRYISYHIIKRILLLNITKKSYINKYDRLKKTTYSTREIAARVNVSRAAVHQIIQLSSKNLREYNK